MSVPTYSIKSLLIHYGINPQANGLSTLTIDAGGDVLSVAPNGDLDTRPKGTNGPWECGRISGGLITYNTDNGPVTYAIAQAV